MDRIKYIVDNAYGKCLDIGGGHSFLHAVLMHKINGTVYGLDLIDYTSIYKRFKRGNAESLPYPDNDFDTVILPDVIMHVHDKEKVLSEIHRVLKPEGNFILSVPNFDSLWNRVTGTYGEGILKKIRRFAFGYDTKIDSATIYQFQTTSENIKTLLNNNGFELVDVSYSHRSDDMNGIFTTTVGLERGWLIDIRILMGMFLPSKLKEEILITAKRVRE